MVPSFPTEVLALVLGHLQGDRKALQKASLASQHFCFLAQQVLFSTIRFTQLNNVQDLLELENTLLTSPRGENIALGIRTLSFLNCSKLFSDPDKTFLHILQIIVDRAKQLRAVRIGPFFHAGSICWNLSSEELRSILIRFLTTAEEIVIEGVDQFPTSLFPKFTNLQYLDVSRTRLLQDTTLKPTSLPSPRSLTLHGGVLNFDRPLKMNNSLSVFASLKPISFSNLRVLHLYAPLVPGRNALYRNVISFCDCARLESLRFYIEGDDEMDCHINDPIINLRSLTSLRSLYVIVNVNDSLGCLSRIVNTLSIPQTHLKDLFIFIDTNNSNMEEDAWLEDMIIDADSHSTHSKSWKTLDSKLAQIFKAWSDTLVVIQFPPVDPLLNDDVYDFVYEQLPGIEEYIHHRFHILDFNFRNVVMPHLSFREEEEQIWIMEDFVPGFA